MKKQKSFIILCAAALLAAVLAGCGTAPAEEASQPSYQCLPSPEEASWETVMAAAIAGVAEAAEREDEPAGFDARYQKSPMGGICWVVTLIYAGGDIYNVNVDSTTAQVSTIVKMPPEYGDALNAFYQAGTRCSQEAELIYQKGE